MIRVVGSFASWKSTSTLRLCQPMAVKKQWQHGSGVKVRIYASLLHARSTSTMHTSSHGNECQEEQGAPCVACVCELFNSYGHLSDVMVELPFLDCFISMVWRVLESKALQNDVRHVEILVYYFGLDTVQMIRIYLIQMFSEGFDGFRGLDKPTKPTENDGYVKLTCEEMEMEMDFTQSHSSNVQALLKAYGRFKKLSEGQRLYFHIIEDGFEVDTFIGSALVDMYIKCDAFLDAVVVFNSFSVHDVVLWTALIAGYAENGLNIEALNCLKRMRSEGLSPNAVTYLCCLKGFQDTADIEKAHQVHAGIVKQGFEMDVSVGSALVDMYGKCGFVIEAQAVFRQLSSKNAITWNTYIGLYAENLLGDGIHGLLSQMQFEGVCPDAITFLCSLKGCSVIGADECRGQQIHSEIFKRGFDGLPSLGNALVDMYSKCGLFREARDVFNKLSFQNVVAWTALITGYIEHGFHIEALACFEQMQVRGVSPDVITFVGCLKAASSQKDADKGQSLHLLLIKEEFEKDVFLGNGLVDMYGQCGLLAEAYEVLRDMPFRDAVSWNSLIAGFVEHGYGEAALTCLNQMQEDSILPDVVTFICSLKACTCTGEICRGQEIHAEIAVEGYETDVCIGNTLVDMYFKCGSLVDACELFDELPDQDIASWTARISGYADRGHGAEALHCFEEMRSKGFSPNSATFVCGLKACGSARAVREGQFLHAEIFKQGISLEQPVGSSLVDMYGKCGFLVDACHVFRKLSARDDVSFNALMWAYAERGRSTEALKCMEQMASEGVVPDGVTFSSIVKACATVGDIWQGQAIHMELVKKALERDAFVGGNLVDLYVKCGLHAEAHSACNRLLIRDAVAWNTLISGYAEHGESEEALKCMDQMRQEGVPPNEVTYVCSLKACGNLGALHSGQRLHANIVREEYERDPFVGNTLVDMYSKCGALAESRMVFGDLPDSGVISWNVLLAAYANRGADRCVCEAFEAMNGAGIEPNATTLLCLLTVCNHVGLLDAGQRYFVASSRCNAPLLGIDHFNCLIDLLGRAGQLDNLEVFVETMPLQPNRVSWSSVLSSCRKWKNVGLARWAFDHAVNYSEKEASTFVSMSNICAEDYM